MTTVNTYQTIDRFNRPGVLQRVGIRCLFISNGQLTDPYEISSVTVFAQDNNLSPSTVLASTNEINWSGVSSAARMHYANSGITAVTTDSTFDVSNYVPGTTASGIYKLGTGDYIVVLDGTLNLSGNLLSGVGYASAIENSASAVRDYIDVWTVKYVAGSNFTTVINSFRLYSDTFVTLTEPLLLRSSNKLLNKHIRLGEVVDLKVDVTLTVENANIDEATRNLFDHSVLTSGMYLIEKINEEDGLPSIVAVSGYADTSASVQTTSDDTLIFNWDTNILKNWSNGSTEQTKREEIGSPRGTYAVTVKYTLLNETKISSKVYFSVN